MGQNSQGISADRGRVVSQASVHPRSPRFQGVGEPEREISGCDDQISADNVLGTFLKHRE